MNIPQVPTDPEILHICEQVGEGGLSTYDGLQALCGRLQPTAEQYPDMNRLSVVAIRMVEQIHERSKGLLMTEEEQYDYWSHPQPLDTSLRLDQRLALLVLGCIQITSMGSLREGCKRMHQALDQQLPDDLRQA